GVVRLWHPVRQGPGRAARLCLVAPPRIVFDSFAFAGLASPSRLPPESSGLRRDRSHSCKGGPMFACPICRVVLERGGACPEDGAELDAIELASVPRQLQRQFRVDRPYAHGDTGTLYVARDPSSGSFGLLKVLRLRANASHAARDGLLRQ